MPDNTGQVQEEYLSKLMQLESRISGDTVPRNFSENCQLLKTLCGQALIYENRMKQYAKEIRTILQELKVAGGFKLDRSLLGSCCCQCHENSEEGEENGGSLKASTTEAETQTEFHQTTDFIPPQGSSLTVGDMVTQAANEMCVGGSGSDYVYNEQYQMYFSQNTGYYWDPKTKLFFLAATGTYYSYDEELQTYTVVEPPSLPRDRRRRSRSRERRRRRSRSRSKSRDRDRRRRRSRSKRRSTSRRRSRSNENRKHSSKRKRRTSVDEGEILSDSVSVEIAILSEDDEPRRTTSYPPCIRFVVKRSLKLQLNSVQILPFPGGILGTPLKSDVCVPDVGVGKRQCNIFFESDSSLYKIEQLDGTHITRVNGKFLKKGEVHELVHMDRFEFGDNTALEAHVHDNGETCGNCEPGLLQRRAEEDAKAANLTSNMTVSSEAQRRKNMKELKKQYGLEGDRYTEPVVDAGYPDRASARRKIVGSDFPHEREAEPATMSTPVEQNNKGFKMLQGMGWKEGEGLGKSNQGGTEPVAVQMRNERAGLGNEDSIQQDEKGERWRKTRNRYDRINQ